jgi:hypothetical protein
MEVIGMDNEVSVFLQNLLLGLISAFVPVLAAMALAWVKAKLASLKAQYPTELDLLDEVCAIAVKAAEQANLAGLIGDKKAYALGVAQIWLASQKIKVDLGVIDAAIEAAVWSVFTRSKLREE